MAGSIRFELPGGALGPPLSSSGGKEKRKRAEVGLAGATSVGNENCNEPRGSLEGNHQLDGLEGSFPHCVLSTNKLFRAGGWRGAEELGEAAIHGFHFVLLVRWVGNDNWNEARL